MDFTKVETVTLSSTREGRIAIKPFIDTNRENMGLENYGLSLFDGVFHEEQLACLENNGVKRYVTGLNEFAPEVILIPLKEEKDAKIKQIRTIVSDLEKQLAANVIEVEDKDFWAKVKLLRPDNSEFWDTITLKAGNNDVQLNPKDPYDLIKLMAIEANGFNMVAKNLEDARTKPVAPKFYLDKTEDTIVTKNELKKLRNKALSILEDLMESNSTKLFYITKVIDAGSPRYRHSTSKEVLYGVMDEYIMGNSFDKPKVAAKNFVAISELSMEDLKLRSLVKDSTYFKIIHPKSDGQIYHSSKGACLGRNPSDVVEFLKNPLNEDIFVDMLTTIEKEWNRQ